MSRDSVPRRLHRSESIAHARAHVSQISRRIHGWSWQAYPIGMGTGAVYVTLAGLKNHPGHPLTVVETVFYFLNMVLFLLNTTTGIFVPLMVLSFATIIIGTINYGIPSGRVTPNFIYGLFWTYVALSVAICFPMLMVWFNKPHDLAKFTPAWAFLVFPMMLVGVVAFNTLKVIAPEEPRALGVLLTGYIFQGLGFFMTFFYICIYILRIMTTGFMDGHQANGAFIACGPPGFTALALINLGDYSRDILKSRQLISDVAGDVWYAGSIMAALLLFGLAIFFFIFGALPYWFKLHKNLSEILGCWALTFPNVGWILTLRKLGDIFDVQGFHIWNLVMTICMCVTWLVLFVLTVLAFWEGKIFISTPEAVIRDQLHIHIVERHHEDAADLEKGDILALGVHRDTQLAEVGIAHSDSSHILQVSMEAAREESPAPAPSLA